MFEYRIAALLMVIIAPGALAHDNVAETFVDGEMTCIRSNGAPDHEMGRFPNAANPNAFREQELTFCFPTSPRLADTVTEGLMTVGVSVTGVPIRPYTAGYYDPDGRRGIGRDPSSGWRQQAMHNPRSLGMDDQNAHIDRSGLYHYHAVSGDLLHAHGGTPIGYAPDGFEIWYDPAIGVSSWALRPGERLTPPGGAHDGTFEEDFEYIAGSGTLDECNGTVIDGTYTYFATDTYPYFPRCFKGVVNPDFMQRPRGGGRRAR
ncbi:YHYH protein [Maricaulis sp.]|uniref:YHYH protein n=1 Tax=Maricaulis sp. TaxID=1486257 RepID=UPI003A8F84EB